MKTPNEAKWISKIVGKGVLSSQKIYKTIKILQENGLGAEIDFGYNVKQFKCKNGCEHHNHLVCVVCGGYSYIDDGKLEAYQDQLAKDNGFKPTKQFFRIYGVCKNCQ